jgi:dual specificity tyrosine-phosphorylation-regulated kinase 2/3/4
LNYQGLFSTLNQPISATLILKSVFLLAVVPCLFPHKFLGHNTELTPDYGISCSVCNHCSLQVLRSLAFLHGLDLIHCDLKPENIMIADFELPKIKIIDLGSSCFKHDRLATYVQSRSYRAPEVILKAGYDGKIDVLSLGAILVELLTGNVLFAV